MTIKVGDKLPAAPASLTAKSVDDPIQFSTKGKIVIVGVPGAFTPSCSDQVPSYFEKYKEFLEKGVKEIYIIAVNDQFVMNAWGTHLAKLHGVDEDKLEHIHLCADRAAEFVKLLGLDFDATGVLGNIRSKRFALVAEDGVVQDLNVENTPPELTCTMAPHVLQIL